MAALSALLPSTMAFRGFAAFKGKQGQLRLKRQSARAEREQVLRITQELASCSDRHLADLGPRRSDIPEVAQGTYCRD